jgi:(1->4)-alpha-D-glucan 1-alpha-D-glucosylmutase
MKASAVPVATYRLQLSHRFGFDQAAELVPYLKALGVSHLYASPFLKARAGSSHGYDLVDHTQLNPELGGDEAFARLTAALAQAGLGLILDFVPNHMGVHYADNPWWLDVLEWGPRSRHANAFDIAWDTLPFRHGEVVLLPILGSPYGDVLEKGELALKFDPAEGSFSVWYYEHRLPIRPDRYGEMLRTIVAAADAAGEPAGRRLLELAAMHRGPRSPSPDQAPGFKKALAEVEGGAALIERGIEVYRPRDRASAQPLHRLLERQHYRVAHWRTAASEINYRRFFDVNGLAGLRVEHQQTFKAVHALVGRLIGEGRLQGLRLDHIDGLREPIQYHRKLDFLIRRARPGAPFYVIVEKILAEGERMPRLRGVAGTTGYEWMNVIARTLVDDNGLEPLEALRQEITENPRRFPEIFERAQLRVLETMLNPEFTVLTRLIARIAAGHYGTRDYTIDRLSAALRLFVLNFPVYRTYVSASGVSDEDRAIIGRAIEAARAQWFGPDADVFDFLRDALTLDLVGPERAGYSTARVRRFALKMQQFTGPMMAKSLEDTTFYRYHRLIALNEVGGEPALPGLSVADFHQRMETRAAEAPHGLTATATHDTKRGEDARMRILSIAELASEWGVAVRGWREFNAPLAQGTGEARIPSLGHEYMLYQALVGAWPLEGMDESFAQRMQDYAIKAAREGKVETSWINPNARYEDRLTQFVRDLLDPQKSVAFLEAFEPFARRTALIGALNSLSQLALKLTMPGVPDLYQGTEFWDLSLVDPDNRRPVDFAARTGALAAVSAADWQGLAAQWQDGRIKLALTHRLLGLRNALPALFTDGVYRPVEVRGPHCEHVIAFARVRRREAVIVAVGRHYVPFTRGGREWPAASGWDAALAMDGYASLHNVLIDAALAPGPQLPLSTLFDPLPVAVLRADSTSDA